MFTVPVWVVVAVVPPDVVAPDPPDDWGGVGITFDVCVDIHPYDPGGRGPDVSAPWYLAISLHGICWPFHQHVTVTTTHLLVR